MLQNIGKATCYLELGGFFYFKKDKQIYETDLGKVWSNLLTLILNFCYQTNVLHVNWKLNKPLDDSPLVFCSVYEMMLNTALSKKIISDNPVLNAQIWTKHKFAIQLIRHGLFPSLYLSFTKTHELDECSPWWREKVLKYATSKNLNIIDY